MLSFSETGFDIISEYAGSKLSGLLTSMAMSLSAVPLLLRVSQYPVLPEPGVMTTIGFLLLGCIAFTFTMLLPPSALPKSNPLAEGRGILYYSSCLFMWAGVADLTVLSTRKNVFSASGNRKFFSYNQPYYETPHGVVSQIWNGIVHYCLHLAIIYKIDNGQDPRTCVLYWCGSLLTSQLVTLIGALTGSCSRTLEMSMWMNVVFFLFPLWVLFRYLVKPRSDLPANEKKSTTNECLDVLLCPCLIVVSVFSFFRGLGALNSHFLPIKSYVENYEPYIIEPSNFGAAWVLCAAVYGVPFQLAAVYGLLQPGKQWMLNLSVVYAGAMMQGTFAFIAYSWFPSADDNFRTPDFTAPIVLMVNIFLVAVPHVLMCRCLSEPGYFRGKRRQTIW